MATTNPSPPAADKNSPAARFIGRVLDDRYRIVELLGEGGMGAVFVAEHLKLRKQVALKTIRTEFAAHSQAEERFRREALATAQLEHPHIASATDYNVLPEGGAYLVTQLVRGESLAKLMARGPLEWERTCDLGAQIADALAAAHGIGVVHRDLKPDNILLERRKDGGLHARVVDFGIARVSGEAGGAIADAATPITRMGAVIGTPGYMSPEQAVGQQVDHRADLYALGVILWECCTGQMLWQGDSLTELLARQLSRPPPQLSEIDGVRPDFAAIVARLLSRAPEDRPATAAAVRDELQELLRARSQSIPPETGRPTIAGSQTTGERAVTRPMTDPGSPKGIPRAAWFSFAGVAFLLVVAALVGGGGEKPARRGRDAASDTVPPALADAAKALLEATDPKTRNRAAAALAAAPESSLPTYLRDLALLEKEPECEDKRPILRRLADAGDARVLPGLKVLAASPPGICKAGSLRFECIECIRDELREVIAALE